MQSERVDQPRKEAAKAAGGCEFALRPPSQTPLSPSFGDGSARSTVFVVRAATGRAAPVTAGGGAFG
jgi:hypothetical protein